MNQADIANPQFLQELAEAANGMAVGNLNVADQRCYLNIHYRALFLSSSTPRADKFFHSWLHNPQQREKHRTQGECYDFACQLERELADAHK